MKTFLSIFLFLYVLTPTILNAEELNAGFVQGLWYSDDVVFADTTVRIYAALRNNTEHDLSGTMTFRDNDSKIGTAYVTALPGRLVEGWVDWTATYGEHTISSTLTDIKLHAVGETPQPVDLVSTLAEDILIVDYDTDNDGIGNDDDTDDDNDGISDEDEAAAGTDPLSHTPETDDTEEVETTGSSRGLEQYFSDGSAVDTVLSNVTTQIERTKAVLDTYRETRNENTQTVSSDDAPEEDFQSLKRPDHETFATITRSQIEKDGGFLKTLFEGVVSLFEGTYTLILWALSNILAHVILVQVGFLLLILYLFYRVARRIGRRPQ
jgi:hypothetical protein